MKSKIFCLLSGFLLAAMLVLGSTVAYAQQTPDHIVKFGSGSPPSLVDSIIIEDPISGNIGIGTTTPDRPVTVLRAGRLSSDRESFMNFKSVNPFIQGDETELLVGADGFGGIVMSNDDLQLRAGGNRKVMVVATKLPPFDTCVGRQEVKMVEVRAETRTESGVFPHGDLNIGMDVSLLPVCPGNGTPFISTSTDYLELRGSPTGSLVLSVKGNVGIGESAPDANLHVRSTTANPGNNTAEFRASGIGLNASHIHWGTTGDWYIRSAASRGKVILQDSGGNVGIGTTAPTDLLSVNGQASKPGGGFWANFSDERLKVIHGSFDAGLNEVLKLRPIRYRYNKDNPLGIRDEGEHIGLSAQEVQRVIPEAVTENSKGYLMLNNDPVLWAMLNAIKEQQKMIEELKKRASEIDGLRAQLNEMDELKAQVGKLEGLLKTVLAQRPEEPASDYVLTSGR